MASPHVSQRYHHDDVHFGGLRDAETLSLSLKPEVVEPRTATNDRADVSESKESKLGSMSDIRNLLSSRADSSSPSSVASEPLSHHDYKGCYAKYLLSYFSTTLLI